MNCERSIGPATTAVGDGSTVRTETSTRFTTMAQGFIEPLTLWVAATNAWIIAPQGPGGECVLIDAPPEPGPIIDRLVELDLRLVALISTHGHIDHVGGISTVVRAQEHEEPVHIHDDDKHMLVDVAGSGGGLAHYLEGLDL